MSYNKERVLEEKIIFRLRTFSYGLGSTLVMRHILDTEVSCVCCKGLDSIEHICVCKEYRSHFEKARERLQRHVQTDNLTNKDLILYNQEKIWDAVHKKE